MLHFTTERMQVRDVRDQDAAAIFRLFTDPVCIQFIGDKGFTCEADALAYIHSGPQASYAEYGFGLWALVDKASDEVLGLAGLLQRPYLSYPDVGYALLPEWRGMGLASEAVGAVVDYAINRLQQPHLLAMIDRDNQASINVVTSLGFAFNGYLSVGQHIKRCNLYSLHGKIYPS
ncbi:GNAT family N-acetyltransferase [Bowmanella sp. JS7-9]|uniref:GNAT family N-acetyltransferase n=1 Tax=Pseudobowmanella zhangzhouensis TaxID=1537679 RepID=A0ABW1XL73_9ALTE|nr:GNAT family N-acetyltransferase [Bowmanella sp. JS7-9]